MSRKKTAKRTAKRQLQNNILATIQNMEKELLRLPSKITAQINKDILALKQKENQLKKVFNKHMLNVKDAENRIKGAAEKTTLAGKKQYKKAKKNFTKIIKDQDLLQKQLDAASELLKAAMSKQVKLVAFKKHMNQFEKDWGKNATQMAKEKKKGKKKKPREMIDRMPVQEISQSQNLDSQENDIRMDEVTEVVS